jgi:myo-inositol-1(or 4)-monophosphatase
MLNQSTQQKALAVAVRAAQAAGKLIRSNLREHKTVNSSTQHDVKLELDVRCQELIEQRLHAAFPDIALLGEEGVTGDTGGDGRWVVDPIDGTVNFSYGIPHACVSIALQVRAQSRAANDYEDGYRTLVGVVYDPFCDEMWTAIRGQKAHLNGTPIRVSTRKKVGEAIVSIGFAKDRETIDRMLPYFNRLAHQVRKIRMMGSAALALTYVATGRFDAYIERGIRLWDIAAGGLILECAGGIFRREPVGDEFKYRLVASNGVLNAKFPLPR